MGGRLLQYVALVVLTSGCTAAQPSRFSAFVEVGAGYLRSTPSDAGPRDIRDVENPRGVLAAGVSVELSERLELSGTIRHESGAIVYDYGQTGVYVTARYYLLKRN